MNRDEVEAKIFADFDRCLPTLKNNWSFGLSVEWLYEEYKSLQSQLAERDKQLKIVLGLKEQYVYKIQALEAKLKEKHVCEDCESIQYELEARVRELEKEFKQTKDAANLAARDYIKLHADHFDLGAKLKIAVDKLKTDTCDDCNESWARDLVKQLTKPQEDEA